MLKALYFCRLWRFTWRWVALVFKSWNSQMSFFFFFCTRDCWTSQFLTNGANLFYSWQICIRLGKPPNLKKLLFYVCSLIWIFFVVDHLKVSLTLGSSEYFDNGISYPKKDMLLITLMLIGKSVLVNRLCNFYSNKWKMNMNFFSPIVCMSKLFCLLSKISWYWVFITIA